MLEYKRIIIPAEFGKNPQELNKKQAEQFFDWFTDNIDNRLTILKEFIDDDKVLLNYSPDSLIYLWKWFEPYITTVQMSKKEILDEIKNRPSWMKDVILEDTREISSFTLAVGIDIAIYFAETFRRNNDGVHWGYIKKPKNHISYNRPVLFGFVNNKDLNPILIIKNLTWKAIDPDVKESSNLLYDIYNVWLDYILR